MAERVSGPCRPATSRSGFDAVTAELAGEDLRVDVEPDPNRRKGLACLVVLRRLAD